MCTIQPMTPSRADEYQNEFDPSIVRSALPLLAYLGERVKEVDSDRVDEVCCDLHAADPDDVYEWFIGCIQRRAGKQFPALIFL